MAGAGGAIIVEESGALRAAPVGDHPQFLHALLCQLGLPRRKTASRVFERRSGNASLLIEAGRWFTGLSWREQPLPYGTRPRLVMLNICSEAVRTRSRTVNIEHSTRAFFRRLGIDEGGRNMKAFKSQMIALACCTMQLGYVTQRGVGQIDTKPISRFEAWLAHEDRQRGLWPGELDLSGPFFDSLIEHAVPLDAAALMALQQSSMALDVYTWMAHRLHRVSSPTGNFVSWRSLKDQFGQEFSELQEFRRSFLEAVAKARTVYPDARLEVVRGGLLLLPSPPSVRGSRTMVKALAAVDEARGENHSARGTQTGRDDVTASSPAAVVTADNQPAEALLKAETLARLAVLDPLLDVSGLYARYARMWRDRWPEDFDERFIRYAKNFIGSKGRDVEETADAELVSDVVVSAEAQAAARSFAPVWDIATLVREFSRWNRERGVNVGKPDKAFLAWVKSYTKGKRPQ